MNKSDFHIYIGDDGVEVSTSTDNARFHLFLDNTAAAQEWIDEVNRAWLRALKQREADIERSKRFDEIRFALEGECGAED